ncbi:MAG: nucleotide sugar dehydrogenase [Aestuariivirgaceae bacterium]
MPFEALNKLIENKNAVVGICGLGYVGLPLAAATGRAGFKVVGFDINEDYVAMLNGGKSMIGAVSDEELSGLTGNGTLRITTDFAQQADCDVIIICVPTPLDHDREPDLTYVVETTETIAKSLRKGQLVILESTTYPGTTSEVLQVILEQGGLKSGEDFFLGYSPEREDPGNISFDTATIPKIVSGEGEHALKLTEAFYGFVVSEVVPVSNTSTAEAVKLTENIFRAVNIALVNELKVIYDAMGIDVWEVIDGAKTKPFGFMPFYPGPGLGGHCIPIDPFYLSWKSKQHGLEANFIELAGEINVSMPQYVVDRLAEALKSRFGKDLGKANVLLLGMAYKRDVSDMRESPSLMLMRLLKEAGVNAVYHDPHVPVIPATREYPELAGIASVNLDAGTVKGMDAVLIATDHGAVDYGLVAAEAALIVDSRNVIQRLGLPMDKVVKA